MSAVESLPTKQKHLIGVGAAVAAGCHPCTNAYVAAAQETGACERGVRFALENGFVGRVDATAATEAFANSAFARPELDPSFREERALLGALIRVAAAVASNAASLILPRIEAARALGATNDQIRIAAQIARTTRRGAEDGTESAISAALGDAPAQRSEGGACGCGAQPESARQASAPAGGACGCSAQTASGYETVRIEKAKTSCNLCEDYAQAQSDKPVVVMSCEGACLRGEISRQAANQLCYDFAPEKTVRLCLGGAFTKDAGQRGLVRNARSVVALEGCSLRCASRMMRGHFPELEPQVFVTDGLCDFDRALFGLDALRPDVVETLGRSVAEKIAPQL